MNAIESDCLVMPRGGPRPRRAGARRPLPQCWGRGGRALGALIGVVVVATMAPAQALAQFPTETADPTPTLSTPTAVPLSVIAPGASVERLATGFQFTEGPAADANGDVFFSDVRASRIHRWSVSGGALTTHREGAVGTNGLYFDGRGRLVVCESGARRVVREEADGTITVLADAFDGKRLNSPNDVWIHPAGHIYFTDPRYGSTADVEQDGMHVYVLPADGGPIRRVTGDLRQPNGVIGTPDGRIVYITDPGAGANRTWRYRVDSDGSLVDQSEYVPVGGDGMAIDEAGNVYLATGGRVRVFAPGGAPLADIAVSESPTNVAFGGADFRTLFITARTGFYAVRMAVRGADGPFAWGSPSPEPSATASATPMPLPVPAPRLYLPWSVRQGG